MGAPDAQIAVVDGGVSFGLPNFFQSSTEMMVQSEPESSLRLTCLPLMKSLTYLRADLVAEAQSILWRQNSESGCFFAISSLNFLADSQKPFLWPFFLQSEQVISLNGQFLCMCLSLQ